MLEWDDHAAAEKQREEEEAGGSIWFLDLDTLDVVRAGSYSLIGTAVPDNYRRIKTIPRMEFIALLREAYHG